MKYVIIRCEDNSSGSDQTAALLDGAKTLHLQHLAQAGAAGTIPAHGNPPGLDRFDLHRALFGLGPHDPEAAAGRCYAASINRTLAEGETAWCCELVTHRDGRIVDPTAGGIPTKESEVLIHALDEELGSETRQWEVGRGPHHVLVVRDPALGADGHAAVRSAEALTGQAWSKQLPKGAAGDALRSVIEQASTLLERHPVNRVRVDLGENPANMLWLWGAAAAGPQRTFAERSRLSGAVVSSSFLLRGFARTLGLGWKEGPASFEGTPLQRLLKTVLALSEEHDLVYVHLRVDSADPVERLCAMERLDQILLKSLTEALPTRGPWRLLTVIDDRTNGSTPLVAIGTGLPQHPVAALTAQSFSESPLTLPDSVGLFSWFTKPV